MVNLPGQIANTFQFTVRSDSLAAVINKAQGQRVALTVRAAQGRAHVLFRRDGVFRQWSARRRPVVARTGVACQRQCPSINPIWPGSYCSAGQPVL